MPFTFSHPAIVLPLQRYKRFSFSLTGLITGSLTPDFEYFIKMKGEREYGHSLLGIFWFDIPMAFLLGLVFHLIIKNPLLNNSPYFIQRKFEKERKFDWWNYILNDYVIVLISIFIGVISHLFLDSFTNENGFFVTHFAVLKYSIRTDYTAIYFNNILSYFLSVLGIIIIIYAILSQPSDKLAKVSRPQMSYWLLIILFAVFILYLKSGAIDNERMKKYWYLYISSYAIFSVTAIIIGLIMTSLIFTLKNRFYNKKTR
ncbi:MAG: DUF4184 family protein [Chitinophagaceae bacterium]